MKRRSLGILAAFAIACTPTTSTTATPSGAASASPAPSTSAPIASSAPAGVSSSAPSPSAPAAYTVLVTDPAVLRAVEANGGSLGALLDSLPPSHADGLARGPRYASMMRVFDADVEEARRGDPQSGIGIAFTHRLLDTKKLRDKDSWFELVGISNRLDRSHANAAACGEIRFVYRLAYATQRSGIEIASRLPVTLAVSFWQRDPHAAAAADCKDVAAAWRTPSPAPGDASATASWLVSEHGPIGPLAVISARFKSVETNVQLVRWPSTTRPDLGGHAEYLLRAFVPSTANKDALVPGPLENTPDTAKIARDPALQKTLRKFLADHASEIDLGTAILPDELLAKRAISASPRGLARRVNRPFRQIFAPADLATIDPDASTRRYAKSPAAMLRRLDELSCQGCHEARSVAGFHLLGEEPSQEPSANAIAIAMSPHLAVEIPRRQRRVAAVAAGATFDASQPIAERGDDEPGRYGAHCGLGDAAFAGWTCAAGLTCTLDDTSSDDRDIGVCLPASPMPGDPCEPGIITPNANPHGDRVSKMTPRTCGGGAVCEENWVGFPGGMCQSACGAPGATCAGIPILTGFNQCLAKKTPFAACIADNTRPGGVRGCDDANPCRDDYICARGKSGGACMPPYFLFQLREDGHP